MGHPETSAGLVDRDARDAGPSRRLTKDDRREQLLDAAAELVVERGAAGLSMEALAKQAGVSKALPYLHFQNADDVVVVLLQREVDDLGKRIMAAVESTDGADEQIRAAVRAYLDVVGERGAILTVLITANHVVERADAGQRVAHRFAERLLSGIYGLPPRRARVAAAVFLGALTGAVEAWSAGELRRREVEDAVVSVGIGLCRG